MKWKACLLLLAVCCGCSRKTENTEAVRQAIIQRVSKSMSLDQMDVSVTSVSFHGDQADAVVAFVPKGMPSSPVTFQYNLERQGSAWVVKGHAQSANHGGPAMGQPDPHSGAPGSLPSGHPALSGQPSSGTPQP